MLVSDMKTTFGISQFGNQKKTSIQHYLIHMLHRVLTSLDNNSRGEINAVLCMCIDGQKAFSRQCHFLGVQSFLANGVRPSLIPVLIGYFEDRQMYVRWHGKKSEPRNLPGSGAMGASLGILEFLSQTNNNADCIPVEDRFKYIDDLTTIEVINLITVGLSSLNIKYEVPSDLPVHGQFIDSSQLKSQYYLDMLNEWSE